MPQPVYVLAFSEEQTEIMNAALARYLMHLREHEDPAIRAIIPHVQQLQQALVQEVRQPTVPYVDVKAIGYLSQMNHAKRISTGPNAQVAQRLFVVAQSWLTIINSISVHFSDRDGAWHFGRQDGPPALAQNSPSEAEIDTVEHSTISQDISTREPL